MKTVKPTVYILTLGEASQALAHYISAHSGVDFADSASVAITVDQERGTVLWTVAPKDADPDEVEASLSVGAMN